MANLFRYCRERKLRQSILGRSFSKLVFTQPGPEADIRWITGRWIAGRQCRVPSPPLRRLRLASVSLGSYRPGTIKPGTLQVYELEGD